MNFKTGSQETQGVCVCAFGASDDFPAFYTARSGHRAPYRVPTASDAAKLLAAARALHLASGTVIAVPIPDEYAMDGKSQQLATVNPEFANDYRLAGRLK